MRCARRSWPLWCGLVASVVVAAVSCGVADERPPNRATSPASSADRAVARAQRAARARARDEQAPAAPAPKRTPTPVAKPPPPPPEPVSTTDAGAADAGDVDAGAPEPTVAAADAGPPASDAGTPEPAASCERICDKVISCMRTLIGDMPPGMNEQRLTRKVRDECMNECTEDIDDHADEAASCLQIDDCSDFLDCIKAIDTD